MGPFRQGGSYNRQYPVGSPGMWVRLPPQPCHLADLLVKKSEVQYVKAIRPDAPLAPRPLPGVVPVPPSGPPRAPACPAACSGLPGVGAGVPVGLPLPVPGPGRRGPLGMVMGPDRLDGGQQRAGPCWGDYCEWLPSVTPSHRQRARQRP